MIAAANMAAAASDTLRDAAHTYLAENGGVGAVCVVRDLGCLGIPVVRGDLGMVLAVPGNAAIQPGVGSEAVRVPLAEPGTWVTALGATEVSVIFFVMAWDTEESAVEEADVDQMDANDYVCFQDGDFEVPDGNALMAAWEQISTALDSGTGSRRRKGKGGGNPLGASAAAVIPVPAPKPKKKAVTTVAGLASMLEEKFTSFEERLARVEQAGAPSFAAAAAPPGGVLGVAGAAGATRLGGDLALTRARNLLGVGAADATASGGALQPRAVGLAGAVTPTGVNPPIPAAAAAPAPSGPPAGANEFVAQLAALLRGPASGSTVGEMFGLSGEGYDSVGGYGAGASSFLEGGARPAAGAGGITQLERLIATRRRHPEVVIASNEEAVREAMGTLPGESWTMRLHAERHLLSHAGNFTTLRRVAVILAAALDEGRLRGAQHQHAFLYHAYRVVELACLDEHHDLAWGWPMLGIDDPGGRPRGGLAPVESATLAAYHRDRNHLEAARTAGVKSNKAGAKADPAGAKGGGGARKGGGRGDGAASAAGAAQGG